MGVRGFITAVMVGLVTTLAFGASAHASSIVYIKRGDVWLAKSNGKGQRAITKDGTARSPYRSPAYSNKGVITAVKGRRGHPLLQPQGQAPAQEARPVRRARPSLRLGDHRPFDLTGRAARWRPRSGSPPASRHRGPGEPRGTDYETSVWYSRARDGSAPGHHGRRPEPHLGHEQPADRLRALRVPLGRRLGGEPGLPRTPRGSGSRTAPW